MHRAFMDAAVLKNQGVLAGVFAIRQNLALGYPLFYPDPICELRLGPKISHGPPLPPVCSRS